jgi:hypothetical protein
MGTFWDPLSAFSLSAFLFSFFFLFSSLNFLPPWTLWPGLIMYYFASAPAM